MPTHSIVKVDGDMEVLYELVRNKLKESGWKDEMRKLCRDVVVENDATRVTMDKLLERGLPLAKSAVPNTMKAELLEEVMSRMTYNKNRV